MRKVLYSGLAVVGTGIASVPVMAQAVVEDPLALETGSTALLTKMGTVGAAIVLGGFGFLLGHKIYRMVRRYFS